MIKRMVVICLLLPTMLLPTQGYAKKDENLKVAFIRGGELWVKQDAKELQLTHEKDVLNPQWSYNGEYLAYSSGKNADIIWVYSLKTNKSFQIYKGGSHFEWAPNRNILAFQINSVLNITQVQPDHISVFENVSLGVSNYSWLPDGSGFMVSSSAKLLPTGWTDVNLFIVPLDAHLDTQKIKPFYTLPHESNDLSAVTTSPFKWSKDGKWIAFIGEPTASLSSDQNILCLLSADTKIFKPLDKMLRYEEWFQWAPQLHSLGFIQGEDRLADRNKQLKVTELPSFSISPLSAKGFVDQDFTWNNDQVITVSRAKENKKPYNAEHKELPVLYRVQLQSNQQKQITHPPEKLGDYSPYLLKKSHHLAWFRSDQKQANVWIANSDGSKAKELIHNVDLGMNYYGKMAWHSMIAWYEPHEIHSMITLYGEPAYAKWGHLAMVQVENKYDANIVDYKHLGRKEIITGISEENFKFWLRSSSREFGVYVKIRFEPSTDKVQSISIREA